MSANKPKPQEENRKPLRDEEEFDQGKTPHRGEQKYDQGQQDKDKNKGGGCQNR